LWVGDPGRGRRSVRRGWVAREEDALATGARHRSGTGGARPRVRGGRRRSSHLAGPRGERAVRGRGTHAREEGVEADAARGTGSPRVLAGAVRMAAVALDWRLSGGPGMLAT